MPPAVTSEPATITGRVPMRDSNWEETPAAITVAKVSGR
jgi:hypothetical protein